MLVLTQGPDNDPALQPGAFDGGDMKATTGEAMVLATAEARQQALIALSWENCSHCFFFLLIF